MAVLALEKFPRLSQVGSSAYYFPKEIRNLFLGAFAKGVFTFYDQLTLLAYEEEVASGDTYPMLLKDTVQLYDFLLISALQPQTVTVTALTRRDTGKGRHFTNVALRFPFTNRGQLEISTSEEIRRRKIQANLLKRTKEGKERSFVGVSAVSWSTSPIETEITLRNRIGGERFIPLPTARIRRDHFADSFEGLHVLFDQLEG